jgi:CRP/FNR family transcriptional regulator
MADLADCLDDIAPITLAERLALEEIEGEPARFRRGVQIRPEDDPQNGLYVLKEGCVKSSVGLENGDRQIIRLHFPGDLLGSAGLGYTTAVDALHAANDVTVARLERAGFARLFEDHPRLGMLLYLSAQNERVTLMDRLCSVGQTSARSRVAALLITTCDRLRLQGDDATREIKIPFPFTQTEMGQMAGLSAVHINRVVKSLVTDEVVKWRREVVTVRDVDRLRDIASIPRHARDKELAWLPWPPEGDLDGAGAPIHVEEAIQAPGGAGR